MFVGHALLAFALVGGAAALIRPKKEALALGVLGAAYATVPDVDMTYALVGLVGVDGGVLAYTTSFWDASTAVHRAVTHSVLVAPAAAAVAGAWVHGRRTARRDRGSARQGGGPFGLVAVLGLGLVAAATLESGALGAFVMGLFLVTLVAVAEGAARFTGTSPAVAGLVALVGLATHPFGDVFTGTAPALLYPLDAALLGGRVVLSTDPTLHLLGAFGLELACIWAGVVAYARLTDRSLGRAADPRVAAGAGYAAAALVVPAPTLDLSYPFVFSVLAVGAVVAVPRMRLRRVTGVRRWVDELAVHGWPGDDGRFREDLFDAVVTGLAAVTLAASAYAVVYLTWLR